MQDDSDHSARLDRLLAEYDTAIAYTDSLWEDLAEYDLHWRPREEFSPIAWHLGHQAAVAHFMVRNLTAAEPSPDPALDALMDSATPEVSRGGPGVLPSRLRLARYRDAVADRVRIRLRAIADGDVGAPDQLAVVGCGLLTAVINHEYQHSTWIAEVRAESLGRTLPPPPSSPDLTTIDGYIVLAT